MVRCLERGILLSDFKELTVGMLLDFIITYNNLQEGKEEQKETIIEATQEHFDSF